MGIALPDVHIPLRAAQSVEQILHLLRALALRQCEVAVRQLLADGRSQFAAKHRHHHPHGQQKPVPDGTPLAVRGEATPGHQTMHVRVQQQCLRPGVQRGDAAGPSPEVFRIA